MLFMHDDWRTPFVIDRRLCEVETTKHAMVVPARLLDYIMPMLYSLV
jgi:hypothetical protein